ncbi:hypothetical protein ACP70R_016770 [Stipagrostis hirtigluma subsp. patula]
MPVMVFVEDYFGFKHSWLPHSWLPWVASVIVAFTVLFGASYCFAIRKLDYQKK